MENSRVSGIKFTYRSFKGCKEDIRRVSFALDLQVVRVCVVPSCAVEFTLCVYMCHLVDQLCLIREEVEVWKCW